MNELVMNSAVFGVVLSIGAYEIGLLIRKKTKNGLFNPLLIANILVILFLLLFRIDYESFNLSGKYLSYLLTPATICLAIPLYQQVELLKKNFAAIMIGVLSGVIASMVSVLVMSILFRLSHVEYVTFLPKSITSGMAMGITEELGGYTSITVASIAISGIFGNVFGEQLCRLFRIKHPISKGLALGTSTHATGTAKAMEMGAVEGAMSGLAMVVAGLCTVVAASVFAMFW